MAGGFFTAKPPGKPKNPPYTLGKDGASSGYSGTWAPSRTTLGFYPACLTQPLLFLPFRWASFAEGTKKLLKLRRTGKRMKTVGTGSRKTSDPLPHPVTWPSRLPVVPIFVSSIFGRKNLLQIFRRPHDAVLVLILSSPGGNLRQPLRPGRLTGTTTTSFSS